MRHVTLPLAVSVLTAATPSFATQGLECRSPGRPGFELYLSVGSGGGVDLVHIAEGRRELTATGLPDSNPRIAFGALHHRSGRLTVRIVGRDGRPVASLDGTSGSGTLRYRGRTWRVRCRWEAQD
jgi:hypothetical protein